MAREQHERIHQHGTLGRIIREEAERWGWQAKVENLDFDPTARPWPQPVPGRADVVLSRDFEGSVTFEYRLPEDGEEIRKTIRSLTRADELQRKRGFATVGGPVSRLEGV